MSAARDEFNELMRDKEKRTRHPEDGENDDARSFLDLSDDDATPPASHADPDDNEDAPRPSLSSSRSTIPMTRYGANTGPKGVISDAQDFQDSQRRHRSSLRGASPTLASQVQRGLHIREQQQPVGEKAQESDEDGELTDDGEFMERWRRGRFQELQGGRRGSQMHNRERGRRVWGGMATVDGEGYLEAVDKSPSDTVVVVYIYDDCVSRDRSSNEDSRMPFKLPS